MRTKSLTIAAAVFALFIISCGGGGPVATEKVYDYERTDSLPPDYMRSLGSIRVSIEETNEMYQTMMRDGYAFNSGALNSASKATSYSNSKQQAFNLGAYSSDLSYAVANEQSQEALQFVKAIVQISEKLGIQKAFNEEDIAKLTDAADTTSDKSILLTRAYRHAEDQLHSNDRAQLVTIVVTGGWLEGLYIAASQLKDKPEHGRAAQKFWDHAYTYQSVVKMLDVFKDENQDVAELLKEMEALKDPVNHMLRDRGNISQDHIQEIYEAVNKIRTKYV